ncbi:MAG: S41 family peptidase [Pirellulaceae bacterium]
MSGKAFSVCWVAVVFWAAMAPANESAKWIRYVSISPNGEKIAFSHLGDLWVVDSKGGTAQPITSHTGYERSPVWSPDSQSIAFMADWFGNGDVFLVSANGGVPTRLTFHSADDEPTSFSRDGKHILFTSRRMDAPEAIIGTPAMSELYEISVNGGRERQIMTTTADFGKFNPDSSRILFQDYKGTEDAWRKHHTSSVTRDLWTFDPATGNYDKLTFFAGEDRNPVWSADGKTVYYLSEQIAPTSPTNNGAPERKYDDPNKRGRVIPQLNSSFNIWKMDLASRENQVQVTKHTTHPVRFLSIASNDTLCYGYNGQVWIKPAGEEPRAVEIKIAAGPRDNGFSVEQLRSGATEVNVSPNEEEVAFVVRGEVFVANVEFGTTKRITNTPQQERSVTWGADNRTLYYAGERDKSWNLYQAKITRDDELGFANSTIVTEEPLLFSEDETFQPVASPDGKKLAYLKNRTELMVLDMETKKSSTLLPAKANFSYTDGDIDYRWSPDSRWLVTTYHGHESWTKEIGAINLATGEVTNLVNSGYAETNPMFASNGTAVLFGTDRFGEKSHGSWGGERDVMALYVNQAAFDEATLSKEELALAKKRREKKDSSKDKDDAKSTEKKDESAGKDEKTSEPGGKDSKAGKPKEIKPIEFDLQDLELRTRRLTLHSSDLGSFDLSPDGEQLIYTAQVDDKWGVWLSKVRDRSTTNIFPIGGGDGDNGRGGGGGGGGASVQFTKDGKGAFLFQSGGRISKLNLAATSSGGKASAEPINYSAEMTVNSPEERAYIFEHAWRQVKCKFYDPKLHGVDWDAMKSYYIAFLPSINNNNDFAELLSEMLGELNASHTGGRHRPNRRDGDATAAFGLIYDVKHQDVGLKVAEVIDRGPCDTAESKIKPGVIITHINGERLTPDVSPWKLLNRMAGKPVRLSLANSADQSEWEETIRPISTGDETNLLYERWIATRRKKCEELSGGKVGYVHVRGMNDGSFRRVYSEVLGLNNEKQALIVDTRFNGGGWLHEDLATFLSGKRYVEFAPRGHENGGLGGEPINKWTKPVAVLQSESNYSDAHFFPWAFKEKSVGKLIGSPVPGTATAVWWETQIDPSIVFGIPQVGMITMGGEYLENNQLQPDILIVNDPQSLSRGDDLQLKAAVEELLKGSR